MKKIFLLLLATCSLAVGSGIAWGQLSGTYYVGNAGSRPGGGDPDYLTLKAACDALNANSGANIAGDCTFYITSNLTEPANVGLGLNTNEHTITFKPYTGTVATITFAQTTDNSGRSGSWVIGVPDLTVSSTTNYGHVRTDRVTIDGSNTVGGTTRDLILQNTSTANINTVALSLFGDVNNITVKHCVINQAISSASGTSNYGLSIVNRNFSSAYYTPDTITVNNCQITATGSPSAQALAITNSGTMSSGWPGTSAVVFTNNNLAARQRGIFLNYGGNTEIAGNEISVNQTGTGYLTYGIMPNAIATGSTINVYNNKIVQLSTGNSNAGTYGIIGIYAGVAGTWNVYNNMVSGFATTTATVDPPIARIWGIQVATVTANVYHNTVYMPDLAYTPGPTNGQNYSGIYITSGTVALMNNIVFSVESSDTSFAIYRPGTTGLTSDYNDFVVSSPGFVGNWNSSVQQTLADWQTASGQDATSKSKIVIFISPTDLHLVAGSIGDTDLAGIALPSVTTDIDGQARPANAPYMGADEHPESPLPVQLISFTAQLQNASVVLRWRTLSEINNYGFYVQKRRVGDQSWNEIAGSFVAGNGTTNDPHDYAYTDNTIASGLWQYRLKQVDLDNSIHFTDPIQVDIVTNVKESTPTQFVLTQNYPNPFNPSTTIRFEIAKPEFVTLKVYDMLGREVAMLANETLQAGSYSAAFNASHLASGTYIYRLQAGAFIATKKMSLTK